VIIYLAAAARGWGQARRVCWAHKNINESDDTQRGGGPFSVCLRVFQCVVVSLAGGDPIRLRHSAGYNPASVSLRSPGEPPPEPRLAGRWLSFSFAALALQIAPI
jgi:hypothetical protein